MPLNYLHLDDRTRRLMLDEIERDIASDTLYISENLSEQGRRGYPDLLRTAARDGNDGTFGVALRSCLNSHEKPRRLRSGELSKPPVMRSNAHEMLAEGEFNRFYMRALCRRAIEDGIEIVVVYRAKEVRNARSDSQKKLGMQLAPDALLEDLRSHVALGSVPGLPSGPNSGLCIRFL